MINNYISQKLRTMSFFLMILVVVLHSYNLNGFNSDDYSISSFIQNFFGDGIARVAVPLFFLISGYLFFLGITGSVSQFIEKIKKRSKSLVIPYLFWSFWSIAIFYTLQSFPISQSFFNSERLSNYPFSHLLKMWLLDPPAYQLWFLRDLMLLSILSPIIFLIYRNLKIVGLIPFLLFWLFQIELVFLENIAVFFFMLGGYVGYLKLDLNSLKFEKKSSAALFFFSWLVLLTFINSGVFSEGVKIFIEKAAILLGIISIWTGYDYVLVNGDVVNSKIYKLSITNFFIFAFHEPFLTIVKKGLFFILGKSEIDTIIVYILTPTLTITIGVICFLFLVKAAPTCLRLITGSRS